MSHFLYLNENLVRLKLFEIHFSLLDRLYRSSRSYCIAQLRNREYKSTQLKERSPNDKGGGRLLPRAIHKEMIIVTTPTQPQHNLN